jgi:TonB dependent receptor-like, beta-barrel/Carboxypeptidase regulatory-like domain
MRGLSRLVASATVGGLVLFLPGMALAQNGGSKPGSGAARNAAISGAGSIQGMVRDEAGAAVAGALVSALGVTTAFARADKGGRFELGPLSPGSYLVRAHSAGFITSNGQVIAVNANSRTSSSIAMRRATTANTPSPPILAAGLGPTAPAESSKPPDVADESSAPPATDENRTSDDHSERAWRLRHLRRGILQEATGLNTIAAEESPLDGAREFGVEPAAGPSTTRSANLFATTPLFGQFNLLTTSSFDDPQQLFSSDNIPRNVAYVSVGAPVGSHALWAIRGALTQADLSSWVVAGSYSTQGDGRHKYNVGLSYATQRYDGGNPAALRDVTDGSRNAGAVYGFDTFTITPVVAVTYGGRYARYDYLDGKTLISPRIGVTISPTDRFRINALVSSRATAPGAEEFLPPGDDGIWLPPQRTFSSLSGRPFDAERTTHVEFEVERDLETTSTLSVRVFRQRVDDQLVTMFGLELPGQPPANQGHYFVGNYGEVIAHGVGTGLRTTVAGRVHGSIEYSLTRTEWNPGNALSFWPQHSLSPMPLRASRIHDIATAVETDVPETSTRIVVLYRVSNAFARRRGDDDVLLDSRFDIQVHQSLPFLDFSTAKWEMLLGIRNFFRETASDQSVYDELLVIRPPKRLVGGLTMRF